MALNALVFLFSFLLAANGIFFLTHQNKSFLLFYPQNQPALQQILKISGSALLLIAVIGILAALLQSTSLTLIVLILGCIGCVVPELLIIQFMNKK
ncbi:hypothetical protein B808_1200 [Fructilactobacillus florum 8D]|uniref:DUF3784 domain-containing protein n=2 Tax=Fructilactobacillus florum TaxID=640331 RepID=W9EJK5_9LACO|nr:hypothetical protein [Fructilactobacillus florum]EKK20886.1 hypothetical protein B807_296 [Fructilactobacillus florum 2F]ETO39869.1 hypothetical protein B808_1200 [Fructilactobacillus florum 8D]KRM92445.1 hypothetical protein FC87_GL000057 [Fructilactobacillus florum DSM 22689 = JCM 16035]